MLLEERADIWEQLLGRDLVEVDCPSPRPPKFGVSGVSLLMCHFSACLLTFCQAVAVHGPRPDLVCGVRHADFLPGGRRVVFSTPLASRDVDEFEDRGSFAALEIRVRDQLAPPAGVAGCDRFCAARPVSVRPCPGTFRDGRLGMGGRGHDRQGPRAIQGDKGVTAGRQIFRGDGYSTPTTSTAKVRSLPASGWLASKRHLFLGHFGHHDGHRAAVGRLDLQLRAEVQRDVLGHRLARDPLLDRFGIMGAIGFFGGGWSRLSLRRPTCRKARPRDRG